MLYFCLIEEGEKKERKNKKKKITLGKEAFPEDGPNLLAVQWVTGVRCN
jgi:hypothetical protein